MKVTKTEKYVQVFHKKLVISLTYNDMFNEEYFERIVDQFSPLTLQQ